ncbi:MAG: glycosyltransferase family 9 protein [Candidatus Omnitrophota bacterium]
MRISLIHKVDYYIGIPLCFLFGMFSNLRRFFSEKNKDIPENPQNILLIKTWGLGNIVMMMPLMKKLRETYPAAKIYFLTLKRNQEILEENPWVDEQLFLDLSGYAVFLRSIIQILRYLRKKHIDIVLDFDQFARITALLSVFISRIRIGFDTKGQGIGFIQTFKVPYLNDKHMALIFADIVEKIGIKCEGAVPVPIPIKQQDITRVKELLNDNNVSAKGPFVIIHVGTGVNIPIRRWDVRRFAELADRLAEECNVCIFLTGLEDEKVLIRKVLHLMHYPALELAGRLSVRELAYLVSLCGLVVANDTSLVHVASAMNTPVIGLYGPNTPFLYGPRSQRSVAVYKKLECSPCITNFNAKQTFCKDPVCMKEITVQEVFDKAKEILEYNDKTDQTC